MFEISDKIVCIDDKDFPYYLYSSVPKLGGIYVIRGFMICKIEKSLGLYLVGITGMVNPYQNIEYGFWATRFRKLSEIKEENRIKLEISLNNPVKSSVHHHDLLITV